MSFKPVSGTMSPNFDAAKNALFKNGLTSPKSVQTITSGRVNPENHKFKFTPINKNPNPDLEPVEITVPEGLVDNMFLDQYKYLRDPFNKISDKYNILY